MFFQILDSLFDQNKPIQQRMIDSPPIVFLTAENIYDKDWPVIELPPPHMYGSASEGIVHPVGEITQLRKAFKIYNGDFELEIRFIPKDNCCFADFEVFFANCLRIRKYKYRARVNNNSFRIETSNYYRGIEEYSLKQFKEFVSNNPTPAALMWNCTNFGCFIWRLGNIFPGIIPLDNKRFSDRVFSDIPPEFSIHDFGKYIKPIRKMILSSDLKQYNLDNDTIFSSIEKCFEYFRSVLYLYPTMGEATVPDAFSHVTKAAVEYFDGNTKEVWAETKDYYYYFYVATS